MPLKHDIQQFDSISTEARTCGWAQIMFRKDLPRFWEKLFYYRVYLLRKATFLYFYVEPSRHLQDEAYLFIVDDFLDVFLDLACNCFIQNFHIYFHKRNCSAIPFLCWIFIGMSSLSLKIDTFAKKAKTSRVVDFAGELLPATRCGLRILRLVSQQRHLSNVLLFWHLNMWTHCLARHNCM